MRIILPESAAFLPSGPAENVNTVAGVDQSFTVTADYAGGYSTFWVASSPNTQGGAYLLVMYAETTDGACSAGTQLNLHVRHTQNGGAPIVSTLGPFVLDSGAQSAINTGFIDIDTGSNVEWEYTVGGYGSGTASVRLKVSIIRLA